jgi:hypothetical protein
MGEREDIEERASKRIQELKTLRDEIRVDLHLAGMDLKQEWHQLERKLPDPERAFEQLKGVTAEAADRLSGELRRFRDRLRQSKTL